MNFIVFDKINANIRNQWQKKLDLFYSGLKIWNKLINKLKIVADTFFYNLFLYNLKQGMLCNLSRNQHKNY